MADIQYEPEEDDLPIDEYFWFNLSRKWVSNGLQNVIDICERLKTAIAWFFGLGTSGFFISLIVASDTFKDLDLSLILVPLLLFFVSYGLAVLGQTISLHKDFEPNQHESIRLAYNKVMYKSKLFIIGSALTLVIGLVSFPLMLNQAAITKHQKEEKNKLTTKPNDEALEILGSYVTSDILLKMDKKITFIKEFHISGKFKQKKTSILRLLLEKGKTFNSRTLILDTFVMPDTTSGQFYVVIPAVYSPKTTLKNEEKVFLAFEYQDAEMFRKNRVTIEIKAVK